MEVDLEGVKTYANFEVIEILDDKDPYLALFGMDWAFDNDANLNLRQRWMSFERVGPELFSRWTQR
jgi:hypothetical protein